MYCGSCFRDNALARALMARGHDVTLMPVYTPTRTDEPNVSRQGVLFGGISVYLQQRSAIFRRLPRAIDRLWDAPGVIRTFAGRGVSNDARLLGDLTLSMLEGEQGVLRKEFEKLVTWARQEPPPDVINIPNSLLIGLAAPLARVFDRPVCCTLQGEELFLDALAAPYRDEALARIRRQVSTVDRFIAVSDYCATFMGERLEIPASRISVVPLGIDVQGHRRRQHADRPFRVGYFARIAPEKGLHVLAEAYVRFRRRIGQADVRLEVAGYLSPSGQRYLDDVRRVLDRAGLAAEGVWHGTVDREGKIAFLERLDLLSVPATYDEPKGMSVLEAMASGVPVVQPRRGSFVEIVEATGGGVLVEPDDPEALAAALYALWRDPDARARLSTAAWEGVRRHYTVEQSADRLIDVYETVADRVPIRL